MKKLLALALVVLMIVPFAACKKKVETGVAMITDYGDITDQSFNQTTHEACEKFCKDNGVEYKYYKPAGDSTAERVAKVKEAINDGYKVIVMPGFAFAETIYEVQDLEEYKDIKFVALDVSQWDIEDCFYNHDENNARTTLKDENVQPHVNTNVYCAVYQEELAGYMAGYAAVKLGYKHLGFLGGMAVPAVIRYGFGFVQGCNAAAEEMGIADQVTIEYLYGNTFGPSDAVKAAMDTWFQTNKVEVVFACGGGIYVSATAAAKDAGAKIIGVDVDQKAIIDGLGAEGMTVTSAMKGLAATVNTVLTETIKNDNWAKFGGKVETLGLVSGEDPTLNYVQIPMESTQFGDAFTQDNYKELVAKMFDGTIKVSNAIDKMPTVSITVNDQGTLN